MSLKEPSRFVTRQVRIDHYSAVHLAATLARETAANCGLPGSLPDQAAAMASELASNLDKHASDGIVFLHALPLGRGMEILAADRGPGMADLKRCLADGYSTTNTLGSGLGAARRVATDFTVRTRVPDGTIVSARLAFPRGRSSGTREEEGRAPEATGTGTGAVCVPADGEQECGDGCAIVDSGTGRTALVVDGLGHGELAARAARAALKMFHASSHQPLPDIMNALHQALRHTRGAAVGLVRLEAGRAQYCGVGNIRLCVLSIHESHRRLDGRPGVVGWNMPTPQLRTMPLHPGQVCVLYSDGIEARWTHDPSPFLLRLPAELLPAALVHRHRRTRDDSTALSLTGLS
ncbi:SpoIIE family protein phosphatase [Streptomyces sp. NPDC050560]|uniref:SpoIIE family protein phosphatase n=1 Tax=Streptomyces sp. NPDC050560 TaxID=3365630 RepID=UPI0037A7EB12